MKNKRIVIFDTTLRDGEQCPGASMNLREKLEVARQLARLKVDVIEAGFPIISEGDFAAVQTIAREIKGPVIAGLARCVPTDIDAAGCGREAGRQAGAHPRLPGHVEDPSRVQAQQGPERNPPLVGRGRETGEVLCG